MMDFPEIIPYTCVFIDAKLKHFLSAIKYCSTTNKDRSVILRKLQKIWTTDLNLNYVLPTTSVRSGLHLFLQAKKFPHGSEIIMSAINIPDIVHIIHHHGLKIKSLDICLITLAPKVELLKALINAKTVAILIAHIFGRWIDVEPYISIAHFHNLYLIEDCAEAFNGFKNMGHPQSDLALFSFGVIKYYTAFGGAIVKVKDHHLFETMLSIQHSFPMQSQFSYLRKIFKYAFLYLLLNVPHIIKPGMYLTRLFHLDHKTFVIKMLRAFPSDIIQQISQQPSTALLKMMLHRFENFSQSDFNLSNLKGEYILAKLPDTVMLIGREYVENNHWLFPILVDDADEVVKRLNYLGVDAYRGATQLTVITSDGLEKNHLDLFTTDVAYEAHHLIDHVIYLPVNKTVPFYYLDKICQAVYLVTSSANYPYLLSRRKILSKL